MNPTLDRLPSCHPQGCNEGDDETSFGETFRRLRKRHAGKQITLVAEGLPCTDAAISLWESGVRLPSPKRLVNIIEILVRLGATAEDGEQLRAAWEGARKIAPATKRR